MKSQFFVRSMMRLQTEIDNAYYNHKIGYPYRGYEALEYLLNNFEFNSVLDVGCGEGTHSEEFKRRGKSVVAIDYGDSYYFHKMKSDINMDCIIDDFNTHNFEEQYDCVWCSHVLEHQLNPHDFLKKVLSLVREPGGYWLYPFHPINQRLLAVM